MADRKCSDCDEPLSPISVVDQLGHGRLHVGLAFTFDAEPRTSAWSGKLKNHAGNLRAFLCESCGRASFFAQT